MFPLLHPQQQRSLLHLPPPLFFFFPDILFFLQYPSSLPTHHLLLLPNPSPHLVYITTSLQSTAAPRRRCHGNSGTTAGWLPLLPRGVASQPPPSLLSSRSSWRSPAPPLNPWIKTETSVWISRNQTTANQSYQPLWRDGGSTWHELEYDNA